MRGSTLLVLSSFLSGLSSSSSLVFSYRSPQKSKFPPSLAPLYGHSLHQNQQQDGAETSRENVKDSMAERRDVLCKVTSAVVLGAIFSIDAVPPTAVQAADATSSGPTIWNSGKAPKVPGQKPKDKNDTSGTRKDGNFLRSIADCKNQCENTTGPDGLSKSKEECLQDCQDICCKTYEQCTFAIVPRI